MAFSLLALLDDVSTLLDDVAILSKAATKKTVGVVGDDIALNANQFTGTSPERELPVVLKVFWGSLLNKAILVPLALLLSYFVPWLINPLLIVGGSFLCYEGVEKINSLIHKSPEKKETLSESEKVKRAIRTDFVLSTEIIVIALGLVSGTPFIQQAITLSIVSVIMTIGVYGFVAFIVKFDDIGFYLSKKDYPISLFGNGILKLAPILLKIVGFVGTWAMLLVGGGIIIHIFNFNFSGFISIILETFVGFFVGLVIMLVLHMMRKKYELGS